MSIDVESEDWRGVDRFCEVYSDMHLMTQYFAANYIIARGETADRWDEIETMWESLSPMVSDDISPCVAGIAHLSRRWSKLSRWEHTQAQSLRLLRNPSSPWVDQNQFAACWPDFDAWWDAYSDSGHETAEEIVNLFEQSNNVWDDAAAPFDTDPLSSILSESSGLRGPLRPSGEVSWSRWLARLLRPSQALVTELFGMSIDRPPIRVDRETQIEKLDGTFRRPDILVFCDDHGVSIEVKLDDDNYRKTAETARLVEQKYDGMEWNHVLLLPKENKERLNSVVEPAIEPQSDGSQRIMWDEPEPIEVVYWQDVTAAIRTVLRQCEAVDDQWAANGYLFCAVAEQRLIGFQPLPIIERSIDSGDFVEAVRPIGMIDILEQQLTYLTERLNP